MKGARQAERGLAKGQVDLRRQEARARPWLLPGARRIASPQHLTLLRAIEAAAAASALWAVVLVGQPAQAQERVGLGWARLFNNDALGDTQDRWRTGSYMINRLMGPSWDGALPKGFGQILDYRFRTEIIAPSNLVDPHPDDRPYAGSISLGLHTHWDVQGIEASLGLDLVAVGEQTGASNFQSAIHRALGNAPPDVSDVEIPNAIYPTVLAEFAKTLPLGDGSVQIRPFVEAQAGVETYLRGGADFLWGPHWMQTLTVRDATTGQLTRAIATDRTLGVSFLAGGDYAYVFDSAYLPSDFAAEPLDTRGRLRAGVYVQGEGIGFFYGMTWLGKEFVGQEDDQVSGSLRIDIQF